MLSRNLPQWWGLLMAPSMCLSLFPSPAIAEAQAQAAYVAQQQMLAATSGSNESAQSDDPPQSASDGVTQAPETTNSPQASDGGTSDSDGTPATNSKKNGKGTSSKADEEQNEMPLPQSYTISFDSNGGVGTFPTVHGILSEGTLSHMDGRNYVERDGFELVGWSTERRLSFSSDIGIRSVTETFVPVNATLHGLEYNYVATDADDPAGTKLPNGTFIRVVGDGLAPGSKDASGRTVMSASLEPTLRDNQRVTLYAVWSPVDDGRPQESKNQVNALGTTAASAMSSMLRHVLGIDETPTADEETQAPLDSEVVRNKKGDIVAVSFEEAFPEVLDTMYAADASDGKRELADAIVKDSLIQSDPEMTQDELTSVTTLLTTARIESADDEEGDGGDDGDDPTSGTGIPRQGDGSNIESLELWWITPDSVENDDPDLLYRKPVDDTLQSVKMRLNYALSGEHDYEPGDVRITLPAHMFSYRDGSEAGTLEIPYPQYPSMSQEFNWQFTGDAYVLTNARKMSAATKGYIELLWRNLRPHLLVDMADSLPYAASIEVTTHLQNLIGLTSNELVARFDMEQQVNTASKVVSGTQWVDAAEVPEEYRVPGETEYVVVTWAVWATHQGNTEFTLDAYDELLDEYGGRIIDEDANDGTCSYDGMFEGWASSGNIGYKNIKTVYPGSQFEANTLYTLKNRVTYTVTEADPECNDDPQKVTTANATAELPFRWSPPEFKDPQGHFMMNKIGNDGADGGDLSPYWSRSTGYNNRGYYKGLDVTNQQGFFHNTDDGYGIYPSALNDLRQGMDVNLSYTVESEGWMLPWQLDGDPRLESSYGKKPVTMTTYDTDETVPKQVYLSDGTALEVGEDYEYVSVEFPLIPDIGLHVASNLNPDGTFVATHAGDGTFIYGADHDVSHIPPITLSAKIGDTWQELGTINWSSGSCVISLLPGGGILADANTVLLPAGVTQLRTSVTSLNAYLWYYFRPTIRLKANDKIMAKVESLFASSPTPSFRVYNTGSMYAYDSTGQQIGDAEFHKNAYDETDGYSPDIAVYPSKTSVQTDTDYERREVTLQYTLTVQERSLIANRRIYQRAIDENRLTPDTSGIFYDLLPIGATPILSTVRGRTRDSIRDSYTIENYKGTGRTLLVVELDLTPSLETYNYGGGYDLRLMDVPKITFDAIYSFEAISDYGDKIHNVFAYESLALDELGTIEHYQGEYDDPTGSRNEATARAFADDGDIEALTGLDTDRNTPSFVYGGVTTNIDWLSSAVTSLSKDVMTNNDGHWSSGLYYTNAEGNKRDVYEGGQYAYRLRMMSNVGTLTKDMVLYDSLENFYAGGGNDLIDVNAPRWRGVLRYIDVSQIESMGAAPVIYYSTVDNLILSDETNAHQAHALHTNLDNADIWVKAEDYTGSLADVHAIAIDLRKKPDGTDFILQPLESVTATIQMLAPSGEAARTYLSQSGVWGASAHAYNNAYLLCESQDEATGISDADNFVRKDYTKVGLIEHSVDVKKTWDDDRDRDGLRPASVVTHLLADGVDTGLSQVLSDANGWTARYEHIPYTDGDGNKISYTITEDPVDGYSPSLLRTGEEETTIVNHHDIETISLSGTKDWVGDTPEARPASIYVKLLAHGAELMTKKVMPAADGTWSYEFTDLPKYRDHGTPIEYTIEEVREGTAIESYITTMDGNDITNTYHPYGNLSIDKTVTGATAQFANRMFDLTIQLYDKDGIPLPNSYSWTSTKGRSGTISHSERLQISGNETITIEEIPEYSTYIIEEADAAGYDQSGSGLSGTIIPNKVMTASLLNEYSASGYALLRATKTLTGHAMTNFQFRFQLLDDDGNVVRSGANSPTGDITFGALSYTEADAGNTYHYKLQEIDRGLGGYTYDSTVYDAYITVTDLGNGHLATSVTYEDGQGIATQEPTFNNTYEAEGHINLKAWKRLSGGPLTDGQFSFELCDANGQVVKQATSDANGNVSFPTIDYDEGDDGATFLYVVREVDSGDTRVNYDSSIFGYEVSVRDNGDGTMTTTQSYVNVVTDGDGYAKDLLSEEVPPTPVFRNQMKPGNLKIQKQTSGSVPDEHAHDEFTFKVQLTGENIPTSIDYELAPAGGTVIAGQLESMLGAIGDLFAPRVAYAADGDYENISGPTYTYNANGGQFSNNSTSFTRQLRYENVSVIGSAISHTENLDDEGTQVSNYGDNWTNSNIRGTNRSTASSYAHVITIPDATVLAIDIEYGGESTNYDWTRIWSGAHPSYSASSSYTQDLVESKIGGTHGTKRLYVDGDTVTFTFRTDSSVCGDGFGYYARIVGLSAERHLADVEHPTRDGHLFYGWNSAADGSGWVTNDDEFPAVSQVYAQWIRLSTTYDANGGCFDDNSANTTNIMNHVPYGASEQAISHTASVNDVGENIEPYGMNKGNAYIVGTNRTTGDDSAHVIAFDGASKLLVDVYYQMDSTSDYLTIWSGSHPSYQAQKQNSSSICGKLSTSVNTGLRHKHYIIDDAAVTFGFYADGGTSSSSQQYGYYAKITPLCGANDSSYKTPTRSGYVFTGWDSASDGSGGSSSSNNAILYAQWENVVTTYDANGGAFDGASTTNVVTYDNISRAQVSHTLNVDDRGHVSTAFDTSGNGYIRGTGRTSSSSYGHVLTVPNAERTRLTIEYCTGSISNRVTVLDYAYTYLSTSDPSGYTWRFSGRHTITSVDIEDNSATLCWYAGALGDIGDGFGYYAVLDYPREAVVGTYTEPKREGYRFVGWDTSPDGTDGISHVSGGTLYAQWVPSTLTFDANGGEFLNGQTVKAGTGGTPFAYVMVSSENRNAAGIPEYPYRNDFDSSRTYSLTSVTVPVAEKLDVSYTQRIIYYDVGYVIDGVYTGDLERSGNYDGTTVTGQLYRSTSSTASYHCVTQGNSVTFGFIGYNSYHANGYTDGWKGIVTAKGQESIDTPLREHYRFAGWNTAPDGSGDPWCDGTGTMYAQWVCVGGECGGVSWAIDGNDCLVFWPTNGISGTFEHPENSKWPWLKYLSDGNAIESIIIEPGVVACEDMSHFLNYVNSSVVFTTYSDIYNNTIKTIDVANLDVSHTTNMANMFANIYQLQHVDIAGWDTSNVANFSNWLYINTTNSYMTPLNIDMSELDTSAATDMSGMFRNRCNTYCLALSHLDTGMVTNMSYMFYKAHFKPEDLSSWNTSSVTNMSSMFYYATGVDSDHHNVHTLDFSQWNTANVTNMSYMFAYWYTSDGPVELLIDNWDTSNVTSMYAMFEGERQSALNTVWCDLSQLDVSAVTDFGYMMYLNSSFKVVDISAWDMAHATNTSYMIGTCSPTASTYSYINAGSRGTVKIIFGDGCKLPSNYSVMYSGQSIDGKWRRIDETDEDRITGDALGKLSNATTGNRERFVGTWVASQLAAVAVLDSAGTLTFVTTNSPILELDPENTTMTVRSIGGTEYTGHVDIDYIGNNSNNKVDLFGTQRANVIRVAVDADSNVYLPYATGLYYMFSGFTNLESFDGTRFNLTNQTSLQATFNNCTSLQTVNVASWDTSAVTSCYMTFYNVSSLANLDLSAWDVSHVTTMYEMFDNCYNLETLNITGWNTEKVTSMSYMFAGASKLDVSIVEDLDVSKVTTFAKMFYDCDGTESLDLSGWDTSSATNMRGMFSSMSSLKSLNVSNWNTSKVTGMNYAGSSTSSDCMFYYCTSLESLDLSSWDVSKIDSFSGMFYNCSSLQTLDISSFSNMDNTKYRSYMFSGMSSLRSIKLGEGFDFTRSDYAANSSYNAVLPTPPSATTTGRWVNLEKDPTNALTPSELREQYVGSDPSMTGTWVWQIAEKRFVFDPNDGLGLMDPFVVAKGETKNLPANQFTYFDHDFTGWNTAADGSGDAYADGAEISNTSGAVENVTLYAQWQQRDHSVSVENGIIYITIPAGYVATVPNLPAGIGYTILEQAGPGWNLDSSTNATGVITSLTSSLATFTNRYTPNETQAQLSATKLMDGLPPAANAFTFVLMEGTMEIDRKGNLAGGGIMFDTITYTEEDTHTYTIKEVAGSDTTIDYDAHEWTVTVNVAKDTNDVLSAAVTYGTTDGEPPTFRNSSKPGDLEISKQTTGAMTSSQEATFPISVSLRDESNAPVTSITVDGEDTPRTSTTGTYLLNLSGGATAKITNLPAGTTYEVSEATLSAGWSQTTATGTTGTIQPAQTASTSFTNAYVATGEAVLQAWKNLVGRTATPGEFTFTLRDTDRDVVVETAVPNDSVDTRETIPASDGETEIANPHFGQAPVTFSPITYDSEGTHHYTITENAGNDLSVNYDTSTVEVTVVVIDTGRGSLSCVTSYANDDSVFENTIRPGSMSIAKSATNATPAAQQQQFSFEVTLSDQDGQPMPNTTYQMTKTHIGDDAGTPGTPYDVTVTGGKATIVLLGGEVATISGLPDGTRYSVSETPVNSWTHISTGGETGVIVADAVQSTSFDNRYSTSGSFSITGRKVFEGHELTEGEFEFILRDGAGNFIARASNMQDGTISFDEIPLDFSDVGQILTYTINEIPGDNPHIAYDSHVESVTVEVTDDGHGRISGAVSYDDDGCVFTNAFSLDMPSTGKAGKAFWSVIATIALCPALVMIALTQIRRDRSRNDR